MAQIHKFRKAKSLFSTTLSVGIGTGTGETITLSSTVGLPTDTEITLTFDRVDADGIATPAKIERITGIIASSNFTNYTRGIDSSTDQVHSAGAVIEYIWNADDWNDAVDGILVQHGQDGIHTSALITSLKATGAVVNTGTSDVTVVTPKAIADSYLTNQSLSRNCLINAGFTVNQRVYVSNATLASGAYGHDRWKAGADGGDYTFTQLAQSTQITIKAGKTLIQVVEDKNVIGGTYTLSWTGTAQARYAVDSATPAGAYAASPIAITGQTAGTVMSIEFNAGTLSNVVLNSGTVALPFMPKSYQQEEADCMRYCEIVATGVVGRESAIGQCTSTTSAYIYLPFKVQKRISPTAFVWGNEPAKWAAAIAAGNSVAITAVAFSGATTDCLILAIETAGSLVAGNATFFRCINAVDNILVDTEI